MQTLDIEAIVLDLNRSAKIYVEDAVRDRTEGKIREWFTAALQRLGMGSVIEITEPSLAFVSESTLDNSPMRILVGGKEYSIVRTLSPRLTMDISILTELVSTQRVLDALKEQVEDYAKVVAHNKAEVTTVPALYVSTQDYMVEMFLAGYAGRLYQPGPKQPWITGGSTTLTKPKKKTLSLIDRARQIVADGFQRKDLYRFFASTNRDITDYVALFVNLGVDMKTLYECYEDWQETDTDAQD